MLRTERSSHRRFSVKKGVLRNFTKFTGKHLCQSVFFNKRETLAQVFSCEFCEISKNIFFREHHRATTSVLRTLSDNHETRNFYNIIYFLKCRLVLFTSLKWTIFAATLLDEFCLACSKQPTNKNFSNLCKYFLNWN